MREVLHVYGMFASFGIFVVAAYMTIAAHSGGVLPGAHGFSGSVIIPLGIACFIMAIHCLIRLVKEAR